MTIEERIKEHENTIEILEDNFRDMAKRGVMLRMTNVFLSTGKMINTRVAQLRKAIKILKGKL